jgi:hypothetical protein
MDTERVVVDALRNEMTILLEIAVAEPLPADNNRCGCPSTCHVTRLVACTEANHLRG